MGLKAAVIPEIDGNVYLDDATDLKPGDMVKATITKSGAYDLWGEVE